MLSVARLHLDDIDSPHPIAAAPLAETTTTAGLVSSAPLARDVVSARICHLEHAVAGRTVIGQAQGILMERHGLSADEAFDRLRVASQHLNRKLRDIAADLVTSGQEAWTQAPTTSQRALSHDGSGDGPQIGVATGAGDEFPSAPAVSRVNHQVARPDR